MKQMRFRSRPAGIPTWAFLLFTVIFDELLIHLWTMDHFSILRLLCVTVFSASAALLYSFVCTFGKTDTVRRVIALLFSGVTAVLCLTEYFLHDAFNTYMPMTSIVTGAGDVAGEFSGTVLMLILRGWWRILLIAAPPVAYGIWSRGKEDRMPPARLRLRLLLAGGCVLAFLTGHVLAVTVSPDKAAYHDEYDFDSAVHGFGLASGFRLDVQHMVFSGKENTAFEDVKTGAVADPTPVYGENKMNIDFASLIAAEKDSNTAAMHTYVSGLTPSKQNAYTGLFKGKNLIMITAEAFSAEVIDPVRTPTLYRLANQGIHFTDYYQPAWGGSTSTGEYSNVIGLVPTDGVRSIKDTIGHNLYFTMGNQLQRLGYFSAAYHNNTYTYYGRNLTHQNLGYATFTGMGNGMEAGVKSTWPESDKEMMDFTAPQYIGKQPFSVYYMTVSGHCLYARSGNMMSARNFDAVKDLPYSETVRGYLAANMELEYAMKSLVTSLETAGIADNTVIVLATDHYPYGLDKGATWGNAKDELANLYGYTADNCFKRDHSALIIWSGSIEGKGLKVTTPTYSLDIVPTLSNLFGVEYDSRLLVGRDVFSDQMPLAIWGNYSWKSDKGSYTGGKFTPNPGVTVADDYVKTVCATVRNKIKYSGFVLQNDYYGKLFPKK